MHNFFKRKHSITSFAFFSNFQLFRVGAFPSSIAIMSSTMEKVLKFSAAIRGFHYYQRIWSPRENEELNCLHEQGNVFDIFAIKTICRNGKIVRQLPREISRITKFILDRGAQVNAVLTSNNYRHSPLVQGGLEILCEVTICMPATITNHMVVDQYKGLLNEFYTEPQEEEILRSILAISLLDDNDERSRTVPKKKKKKTEKQPNQGSTKSHDIQVMFQAQIRRQQETTKNDNNTIIID